MERDNRGRFSNGHKKLGGRIKCEEYLSVISASVNLGDLKEIACKAMEQAKLGDDKARRWITDYLIGQPIVRQADEKRLIDEAILAQLGDQWASGKPSDTDPQQSS